jgi:hypothetical protein
MVQLVADVCNNTWCVNCLTASVAKPFVERNDIATSVGNKELNYFNNTFTVSFSDARTLCNIYMKRAGPMYHTSCPRGAHDLGLGQSTE